MKQLLQDARTGELKVADVPAPQLLPGCVLVRVAASLVSAGTERASAEFASKGLVAKAKARPDLVRDVLAKLRRDGLVPTMNAVRSRLDQLQSVGYSSAGLVVAVADGVVDIKVGDRIACAGAGYAVHAEFACVPRMLVAKIPETGQAASLVSYEEAAFGTVGAICLHGIRTAEVALGDTVAVIGLGLLGQMCIRDRPLTIPDNPRPCRLQPQALVGLRIGQSRQIRECRVPVDSALGRGPRSRHDRPDSASRRDRRSRIPGLLPLTPQLERLEAWLQQRY